MLLSLQPYLLASTLKRINNVQVVFLIFNGLQCFQWQYESCLQLASIVQNDIVSSHPLHFKSTNNIHRQTNTLSVYRSNNPHIQHKSPSLQGDPAPASNSERHPASNERNTAKRRNRTHGLEPLRIQHKQVDRAAKHGHARGE